MHPESNSQNPGSWFTFPTRGPNNTGAGITRIGFGVFFTSILTEPYGIVLIIDTYPVC